jgi:molybdopterin-guanine dinucleotide biosynthesis protein A
MYHRPMDGVSADVAAFILAGGKSTRMGADKAFVVLGGSDLNGRNFDGRSFDGRTLLARALDLGRTVTSDVRIVGDAAKFAAFAPVVEDVFCGCGPLGGIHAGLRASQSELNLMLAVDVPFVTPALLQYLIERARGSVATVTVAQAGGRRQPLCAVYAREFGEVAELALREGRYKIDVLFEAVRTLVISQAELEGEGFPAQMFRNLNTREELDAVRREEASR